MEITPLGDSALLVRVAENFDDASEAVLNKVLATKRNLEAAKIPGVIEVAPAYTTVAFFYNPVGAVDAGAPVENVAGWIEQRIRQALADGNENPPDRVEKSSTEIPVCYETEFGFDLDEVARRAGLHSQEVVDLHSGAEYRVHCLGFTGGFAFFGGLPPKMATRRRGGPRQKNTARSGGVRGKKNGPFSIKMPRG